MNKKTILAALLALATLFAHAQTGEPLFRTDLAVIRGRIEGYSRAMGFRNLSAQVNDLFTNELKTTTSSRCWRT